MRTREQIAYLGELHGMTAAEADSRSREILTELSLGPAVRMNRSRTCRWATSRGRRSPPLWSTVPRSSPRRAVLRAAPPGGRGGAGGCWQRIAARGVPVLFSSHQLDVVERLADNLVIISEGRIRAAGSRALLQEQHSTGLHRIVTQHDAGWIRDVSGSRSSNIDRGTAVFSAPDTDAAQQVLRRALDHGRVTSFAPHTVPLSAIYREIV